MSNMETTIIGRLGADPQLGTSSENKPWVRFRLAHTPSYRKSDGTWANGDTIWLTCKAWGRLAENIGLSLGKGDQVVVQGKFVPTSWESNDAAGNKVTAKEMCLHVNHVGVDLAAHQSRTLVITDRKSDPEDDYGQGDGLGPRVNYANRPLGDLSEELGPIPEVADEPAPALVGAGAGTGDDAPF